MPVPNSWNHGSYRHLPVHQFGQEEVAGFSEVLVRFHQTSNLPNDIVCNLSKLLHESFAGNDYVHFTKPAFADLWIGRALCIATNLIDPTEQVEKQIHPHLFIERNNVDESLIGADLNVHQGKI